MKGKKSLCCKPGQINGFLIHIHKILQFFPLNQPFFLQASNLLSSISEFSDQSFEGRVLRGSSYVYDFNVFFNSLNFTLILPLNISLCYDLLFNSFLLGYDLVKGLLALVSTTTIGEGKSNFLPFFSVVLAKGTSSNSGVG
jgi:hypothetical protein